MRSILSLALTLAACLPRASSSVGPGGAANAGELRGAPLRLIHEGGLAEVPDTQVVVRFENNGDAACVLHRYRLLWGGGPSSILGGSKACDAASITVPARGSIETTCTMASTTQIGAAPGMTVANTTIDEIESTCAPDRS